MPGGLEIAIGAFDDRSDLAPRIQVNHAARLPWVETIFDQPVLDRSRLLRAAGADHFLPAPDHETPAWPAQGLQL